MSTILNGLLISLLGANLVTAQGEVSSSSEPSSLPVDIQQCLSVADPARIQDDALSKECLDQLSMHTIDELDEFLEKYVGTDLSLFVKRAAALVENADFALVDNEEDTQVVQLRGIGGGGGRAGGGGRGSSSGGSRGGSHGGEGSSGGSHGGSEGGSSGGKGGSEGGSSGGKGGSTGGSTGGKGGSAAGYGSVARPDYSAEKGPPPPYSSRPDGPPPPYSAGTYGQRGPSPRYWNGQYYPYGSYGYGSILPFAGLGLAAPLLFAGPFGFWGHYCSGHRSENCTTNSIYVNGTMRNGSSSLYNGTYIESEWKDGQYTVRSMEGGEYKDGKNITEENNQYTAVNGTFIQPHGGSWNSKVINPNYTADGSELSSSDSNNTDQSGDDGNRYNGESSGASSLAMSPLIFVPIAAIGLLI